MRLVQTANDGDRPTATEALHLQMLPVSYKRKDKARFRENGGRAEQGAP
jgi:hypothetical protein